MLLRLRNIIKDEKRVLFQLEPHSGTQQDTIMNTSWHLKSLQLLFTKLAKSRISAQFFVEVFVSGWYTYFETVQVLFSLCFREKGVKTLKNE